MCKQLQRLAIVHPGNHLAQLLKGAGVGPCVLKTLRIELVEVLRAEPNERDDALIDTSTVRPCYPLLDVGLQLNVSGEPGSGMRRHPIGTSAISVQVRRDDDHNLVTIAIR